MAYNNFQDAEFEFIINSDLTVLDDNHSKKIIRFSKNQASVFAYQNWSEKTTIANKNDRYVFPYSCEKLLTASENVYKLTQMKYKPSVLMTTNGSHFLFGVSELINSGDNVILVIDDSLGDNFLPENGNYTNARLNLSTIPFHFLDIVNEYKNIYQHLSILPNSRPSFSFLLETTTSSIQTDNNGMSKILLPFDSNLFSYEQWNINHSVTLNQDRGKITNVLDWNTAINDVEKYNEDNDPFTPTVFITINDKMYLGVLVNSKKVNMSASKTSFSLDNNYMVELTVDCSRMKLANENENENDSLDMLPNIDTPTTIFMNIDPAPGPSNNNLMTLDDMEKIKILYQMVESLSTGSDTIDSIDLNTIDPFALRNLINKHANAESVGITMKHYVEMLDGKWVLPGSNLIIGDIEREYYNPSENGKTDLINWGTITINYNSIPKTDEKSFISLDSVKGENLAGNLYNYGKIIINIPDTEGIDISKKTSFIKGHNSFLVNYGVIQVRSVNDNKETTQNPIVITGEGDGFTFFDTQVNNLGGIIHFREIINKTTKTVTGIKVVENRLPEPPSDQTLAGDLTIGPFDRPYNGMGFLDNEFSFIEHLRPGTILFSKLSSLGEATTKQGINYLNDNKNSYTIGIKHLICNEMSSVIFGSIITGDLKSLNGTTETESELSKNTLSTVGILYLGTVRNNKSIQLASIERDYKLVNPNYNKYGFATSSEVNYSATKKITKIAGNGHYGNIFIGSIENYCPYRNDSALFGACGIYNMIQNSSYSVTFINSVENYGYGGKNACMGIKNLLVNYGQVCIQNVSNICRKKYNGDSHSSCMGIGTVVQNGFNGNFHNKTLETYFNNGTPSENRKMATRVRRSMLPPFPPPYYDKNGAPNKFDEADAEVFRRKEAYQKKVPSYLHDIIDIHITDSNIYTILNSRVDVNMFNKKLYMQGHISISHVNTKSFKNEIAMGVSDYGGYSFDDNVMFDSNIENFPNQPILITELMKKYVHKWNPASIAWSYPSADNTKWGDSPESRSDLYKKIYANTPGAIIPNQAEFNELLKLEGWHYKQSNPVQMYYEYYHDGPEMDDVSDTAVFPINWGILTIGYVVAMGTPASIDKQSLKSFSTKDEATAIAGSAYGIEKVLTSMGRIQIDMIESYKNTYNLTLLEQNLVSPEDLIKDNAAVEHNEIIVKNSSDNIPGSISKLFFGSDTILDLPYDYVGSREVTNVDDYDMSNLDVKLHMPLADISNPSQRVEGIWTTGTKDSINHCWPYHVTNNTERTPDSSNPPNYTNSPVTYNGHESLLNELTPSDDSWIKPSGATANTLYERLTLPGSSYGVFRTIDYGSNAPGLNFLKAFTSPLEYAPFIGDRWNYRNKCSYTIDRKQYPDFGSGNVSWHCDWYRGQITFNHHDIYKENVDYNYDFTPVPNNIKQENELLHYSTIRKPILNTNAVSYSLIEYAHYPFRDRSGSWTKLGGTWSQSWATGAYKYNCGNQCYRDWNYGINKTGFDMPLNWIGMVEGKNLLNITMVDGKKIGEDKYWYNPPLNRDLITETNPWYGYTYRRSIHDSFTYNPNASAVHDDLNNLMEHDANGNWNTADFKLLFRLTGTEDTSTFFLTYDFSDPNNNSSHYIYNSSMILYKLQQGYYPDVFKSNEFSQPSNQNGFNGLTPFPLTQDSFLSEYRDDSYITRVMQSGIIPVPEKILWNPSCYEFGGPMHGGAKEYVQGGNQQTNGERHDSLINSMQTDDSDNTNLPWPSRKNIQKLRLSEAYGDIGQALRYTSLTNYSKGNRSHWPLISNIFASKWPYDNQLAILNEANFIGRSNTIDGAGINGPLNSFHSCPVIPELDKMRDLKGYINCPSSYLSYNYSPTRPIGFNPQLIRGGIWNVEAGNENGEGKNPDYNNLVTLAGSKDGSNPPGFLSLSKGAIPIKLLGDHPDNVLKYNFIHKLHTHDNYASGKYQTGSRYYGFTFENRNPNPKLDFESYQTIEGTYTRYRGIIQNINNQIYIKADSLTQLQNAQNTAAQNQVQAEEQALEQKQDRQKEGAWGLVGNGLMMAVL